jgi:hypothetical protein
LNLKFHRAKQSQFRQWVMAALSNDLKPAIEAQRRLIARWVLLNYAVEVLAAPDLDVQPLGIFPS